MEKSILEKKIKEQSKRALVKEYQEALSLMKNNKILSEIAFDGKRRSAWILQENLVHRTKADMQKSSEGTNIADVLEKRLEQLEQEQLDELLYKLEGVKYLFEQ